MAANDIPGPQGRGARFLRKLAEYKAKFPSVPDFVARRRIIAQQNGKRS